MSMPPSTAREATRARAVRPPYYFSMVRAGGGNGRAPSMTDVAAAAGVSHQTVSRVLNGSGLVRDATRARVLAAIDELGYRRNNAARQLVTNRSHRIGMIAAHLVLHGPGRI